MKFEGYEQHRKVISGWEVQKRGLVDKVSQAQQAVEDAQRDVNRIISEAASNSRPGAAKAISEAQAVVLIAQERLKQAERELDAFPKRPPISSTIYYSLQSEIKQAIGNGTPFSPFLTGWPSDSGSRWKTTGC